MHIMHVCKRINYWCLGQILTYNYSHDKNSKSVFFTAMRYLKNRLYLIVIRKTTTVLYKSVDLKIEIRNCILCNSVLFYECQYHMRLEMFVKFLLHMRKQCEECIFTIFSIFMLWLTIFCGYWLFVFTIFSKPSLDWKSVSVKHCCQPYSNITHMYVCIM